MAIYHQDIRKALSNQLPGASSHKKMLPPKRELHVAAADASRVKTSSVLLLLYSENSELNVCLIKRPCHMKHHAGQIALPGGKIEKGETAMETALRETEEEIGIQPEKIKILGSLSELYIGVSRFQIQPFVGWLEEKPNFTLNKNEVEKTILFPLLKYWNNIESVNMETITGKLDVPCIKFEDEIIWGATAMILSEFYDIIYQISATSK